MTDLFKNLAPGEKIPEKINAVIEVPKGAKNKYEYDSKSNCFKLDRILHSTVYYPGDYGFIPKTLAEDGDELDVLVLVHEPTFTSCVIPARPIALMKMEDNGKEDDKIIAVPIDDPNFKEVNKKEDLPEHLLKEIVQFFETYGVLEENKEVKVIGMQPKEEALKVIEKAVKNFK